MRLPILIIFLFCKFCFITLKINAQDTDTRKQDSLSNLLVERHKKICSAKMTMLGYRIQIYFGSERAKAQELKTDFNSAFPQTAAYLVYHQPNFKVRVGDFRTRLEAQGFLKKLGDRYSTAFIVNDDVRLPDQ